MLLADIIQRVQSLYSKGVQSDDSRLTPRHIYSKVLTTWNKLVSQEAKKNQKTNEWNYITLSCVEMIKAPIHECACLPSIGCEVTRTKLPLPKPLTNLNAHLISSVTSIDGHLIFTEVTFKEAKYQGSNKYTATKPTYYIRNGYLYLTSMKGVMPSIISVTGLWEDPLASYISYCGEDPADVCNSPMEMDFPIDMDMVDTLVELASKELVTFFNQQKEDLTNDGKDSSYRDSK